MNKKSWEGNEHIFFGREHELEILFNTTSQVINGQGKLVLLSGEAGLGKTTLVEHFKNNLEKMEFNIVKGKCDPTYVTPLYPFQSIYGELMKIEGSKGFEIQHQLLASPERTEFHEQIRSATINKEVEWEQVQLKILRAIENAVKRKNLMIWLEDFHWADTKSIELARFISKNLWRIPLLFVITIRPEELRDIERQTTQQLLHFFNWSDDNELLTKIDLSYFGNKDTKALSKKIIGIEPNDIVLDRIIDVTGGNPFYIVEITRWINDNVDQTIPENLSFISDPNRLAIPNTLREIIDNRLSNLSAPQRMVLETASVIGECFELAVLSEILEVKQDELLPILDELDEDLFLIRKLGDNFHFIHEILRKVTYDEMDIENKVIYHQIVGNLLERGPLEEETCITLSHHFYYGNNHQKCLKYSKMAGDLYNKNYSNVEAIFYYQRCVEQFELISVDRNVRVDILECLGDSHSEITDNEAANEIFNLLLTYDLSESRRARLFRKLAECWSPARLGKGSSEMHKKYLEMAIQIRDIEPYDKAEILHEMAMVNIWVGNYDLAESQIIESSDLFSNIGSPERWAWELQSRGLLLTITGKPKSALTFYEKALEIFKNNPWPSGEIETWLGMGTALSSLDRSNQAERCYDVTISKATNNFDHVHLARAHLFKSLIREYDPEAACLIAEKGLESAMICQNASLIGMLRYVVSHFLIMMNRVHAAEKMMDEGSDECDRFDPRMKSPLFGVKFAVEGELFSVKGMKEMAIESFNRSLDELNGVQLGKFYEIRVRIWYANAMERLGEAAFAKYQNKEADQLSNKLKL